MIGILTGCVRKWWEGLSAPSFNVITNYTTIAFESSMFEGVCKTRENSNFRKKGKMVISVKN